MTRREPHSTAAVETFDEHRSLLFSIAYRMLGSVMDAEDVLQEAYLRWHEAAGKEIRSPKSYLSTIVTRLSIDRLRSAKARREHYVGTWLPEPLAIGEDSDADEAAIVDETLSMAFLVLLESLTPVEWAVFLRREVFNYDYEEISRLVRKAETNCRQITRWARETVAARRPRFEASPEQEERLAGSFLEACLSGDMEALLPLLSEDVTLYSDGGGKARAALKPIHGADQVARLLLGVLRKASPQSIHIARINGQPGIIGYLADGRAAGVGVIEASEGRIGAIRFMLNPETLRAVPPLGQVERKEVPE